MQFKNTYKNTHIVSLSLYPLPFSPCHFPKLPDILNPPPPPPLGSGTIYISPESPVVEESEQFLSTL